MNTDNVSKFGLYVKTSTRNYLVEAGLTALYVLIFMMFAIEKMGIASFYMAIIAGVMFLRFIEYQLTGITIQYAFNYFKGRYATFQAYAYLLISAGLLIYISIQ